MGDGAKQDDEQGSSPSLERDPSFAMVGLGCASGVRRQHVEEAQPLPVPGVELGLLRMSHLSCAGIS